MIEKGNGKQMRKSTEISYFGHIQADNCKDPGNIESIENGNIKGSGLIGEILEAALGLASIEAEIAYGYEEGEELDNKQKYSRLRLYTILKELENANLTAIINFTD